MLFFTCVIADSILVDLYPPFRRYLYTFTHTTPHTMHMQHTNVHTHLQTPHTHTCTHNTMCTQDGDCPLYLASQNSHDRIVETLLQAGATVDLQSKVENCYLFICHLCCAMHIIHCTLSTTQHSGEYERQKTYPTDICC